ncbi:MAG: sugar phosphate isomerase/epimerase [Flavitalea sp.]
MTSRRSFIKNSAAALAGTALVPGFSKAFFQPKVTVLGVQLFTLFNEIDADVPGALKKLSAIGYKEIESAFSKKGGYYGLKPKEFAALVKDHGMSWKSHHVLGAPFKLPPDQKMPLDASGQPMKIPPMRNLTDNLQELVDEAAEGGVPYLVCATIPANTREELVKAVIVLNKAGEACKKAGIQFAYHNHDWEFKTVDGKQPYEVFLKETNAQNVKMELDLCWVTKAGIDPLELFKKYPGRFPLFHAKDIDKDFKGPQPVGTGVVDFKRILTGAETAGLKHIFVEHDMPADAYASLTTSFKNLSPLL